MMYALIFVRDTRTENHSPAQLEPRARRDLIKLGFGLDGDRGLNVFAAGSRASEPILCPGWTLHSVPAAGAGTTAGSSGSLRATTPTAGRPPEWAGTCRRFELTLNDGSGVVHSADFMFFP